MPRNVNQTAQLMAGMLAAMMTGSTYHIPCVQTDRESNEILDGLALKEPEWKARAAEDALLKAKLKRERKMKNKYES